MGVQLRRAVRFPAARINLIPFEMSSMAASSRSSTMPTSFAIELRNFGFDEFFGLPMRSSTVASRASASFEINVEEGSSRPRSIREIVGSVTPALEARAPWVSPRSSRSFRMLAAMFLGSRTTVFDGAR